MNNHSRFKTLREYVDAQPRRKTQGDIARELGISSSALSSYLSGTRVPGREVGLRLSRLCNIPLENLLNVERRVS